MNNLSQRSYRPVAIWVYIGLGMLIIQVVLGGITRLTGSGLSITEWNIVTGALPPLTEQQWMTEFEKYRQTPQYVLLNTDFILPDFKYIFFWEWLHRFWARLIAIVFIIPFVVFLVQKRFKQEMIRPLLILFLLGALQGAVGWIMVASGLTGDAIYVKPIRLAMHFVFALVLISFTFWFAMQLSVPSRQKFGNTALRRWTWAILSLLFFQLIYGALMAGHRAATAAPTWPTINGSWWPETLFSHSPFLINFIDNRITIHFIHRLLAYLILVLTIVWSLKAFSAGATCRYFNNSRWMPCMLVSVQVLLGIFSVVSSPFLVPGAWGTFQWLALFHQVTGMAFLLALVWMLYLTRAGRYQ
jgi:cytochrome c oxidase assembly protein subunit 15